MNNLNKNKGYIQLSKWNYGIQSSYMLLRHLSYTYDILNDKHNFGMISLLINDTFTDIELFYLTLSYKKFRELSKD